MCMAAAGQQTPPSTSERIDLSLNGLGEKKLSFSKEGNAGEVHETILAAFPALREGYEILRAGEGRSTTSSYSDALEQLQRGLFAKCSQASQGLSQAVAKRY